MEKLTNEIAETLKAWVESEEVKAAIAATEKAADATTGTFEVVITTENLDRYNEVISLDGWELEHYKANPVVLWGHDHFTLPIGVATDLEVKDGKLIARGKFAPHEHAQAIRQLYDMGVVRATSVGFIPKEQEGNLITKAELLEFSFVSVPANPYALKLDTLSLAEVGGLVTKGIFATRDTVSDDSEGEGGEEGPGLNDVTPDDVVAEFMPDEPEETPDESTELEKAVKELTEQISILNAKLDDSGLEDTDGEPEPTEEPAAETEEKRFADFSAKRKTIQDAATIIGEVLAESRQAIEARKA